MTAFRIRSISTLSDRSGQRVVDWPDSATSIYTADWNVGKVGMQKITKDIVTPGFRKIRASGGFVNNPMIMDTTTFIYNNMSGGKIKANAPWPGSSHYLESKHDGYACLTLILGQLVPAFVLSDLTISALKADVATRSLANIRKPSAQVLVSVAELHKTIDMFRRPLQFASAFTKKYMSKGARVFEVGSNAWLQYRYGIRPLMMEIEGIAKALQTLRPIRSTARAKGTLNEVSTSSGLSAAFDGLAYGYVDVHDHTCTVRAGTIYDCSVTLQDSLGLNLSDIPDAAWELVPYSFVADWFVNMGNYISAMTPKAGVKRHASFLSVKHELLSTRTLTSTTESGLSSGYHKSGDGSGTEVTRRVLYERVPYVEASLSIKPELLAFTRDARLVDAFLLIRQIIQRAKR